MAEESNYYRMNTLMGYSDIDAFAAQKSAGTRFAYFKILDDFVAGLPQALEEIEGLSKEGDPRDFTMCMGDLQDQLAKVGASAMMWDAERIVLLAREEGKRAECVDETFIFTNRLRGLAEKIREAKIGKPEETTAAHAQPVASISADRHNIPQAAVKLEPFQKLMVLIENFELDDALVMLHSLLDYAYGKELDTALVTVYNQLAAFEYDAAIRNLRIALKIIQSIEDGGKNGLRPKILAVDDVPDVLNTVKAVLGERYTVYGVTNHKAALKFLANKHADLILLDIEMPGMDGFAMLGIIRRIKSYETTPVIFLTGSASAENVRKSHALGANDFVRKPIDASVLIPKVEKHLRP